VGEIISNKYLLKKGLWFWCFNNNWKIFGKKSSIIWILNFSDAIFALTKFKHLLKCYQERWRD
jgi:hypothetical protein